MGGVNGADNAGTSTYGTGDATDDGLTTVKNGETSLSQVAARLGVDVDRLKAANPNLPDSTQLQAGQNLHVPQNTPTFDPLNFDQTPQLFPGQPKFSVPPYSLSMRSNWGGINTLNRTPFTKTDVVPGTPLNGKIDEDNLSRNEIVNPSVHYGNQNQIFASGTVSLGQPYPQHYVDPTDVSVKFSSVPLNSIHPKVTNDRLDLGEIGTVQMKALGVGGAKGDVRAFVDLKPVKAALAATKMSPADADKTIQEIGGLLQNRISDLSKVGKAASDPTLENVLGGVGTLANDAQMGKSLEEIIGRHVPPGTDPSVVADAANNVQKELSGPGFSVEGPVTLGVPVGYAYFKADTTRSAGPSSEASAIGAGVPATLMTVGPAIIPAGVLSDIATPAVGGLLAHDEKSSAIAATIAGRPYLDTGVIGVAGVATAKAGVRVGGVDLTAEGGWRGQAPIIGGAGATGHSFTSDYKSMQAARQDAQAAYNENVEKTEAGVFAPDLKPAEVLPYGRPDSELYIMLKATKKF